MVRVDGETAGFEVQPIETVQSAGPNCAGSIYQNRSDAIVAERAWFVGVTEHGRFAGTRIETVQAALPGSDPEVSRGVFRNHVDFRGVHFGESIRVKAIGGRIEGADTLGGAGPQGTGMSHQQGAHFVVPA